MAGYVPGVCNIGPAEERRRRQLGWAGVAITVVYAGIMLATDASTLARALTALPAGIAASGYFQSRMHFCAGFAVMGVYNLDDLGAEEKVMAEKAHRADLRRAMAVAWRCAAVGIIVGAAVALVPVS